MVTRTDKPANREGEEEGQEQIENLLGSIPALNSAHPPLNLIESVLEQLQISEGNVHEFELRYELKDGTRGRVELEIDDFAQTDHHRHPAHQSGSPKITTELYSVVASLSPPEETKPKT